MGVYLSEPDTAKKVYTGSSGPFKFCSGEMQGNRSSYLGWRKNMEDAVIHRFDIGDGNGLFAVFDGHGGIQFLTQGLKSVF